MDGRLLRGDQFSHTELQFRQVGGLGFAAFRLGRLSNFLIYAELSQAGESHSPQKTVPSPDRRLIRRGFRRSPLTMSTVPDTELRAYAENAKGKVVIITGGAMGLGKQAGGEFIRAGCVRQFPTPSTE